MSAKDQYYYSTGRRKTAIARVRISRSNQPQLIINDKQRDVVEILEQPFELVGETGKWQISAKVNGGGVTSQIEAIRLGISRALLKVNADWRQSLKKAGFLTRDPREKERKKPGLKRARRAPQWAKR